LLRTWVSFPHLDALMERPLDPFHCRLLDGKTGQAHSFQYVADSNGDALAAAMPVR